MFDLELGWTESVCSVIAHCEASSQISAKDSCLSVRPSASVEQLDSQWTDLYEILCLRIFRKSVEKIQS